MFDDDDAKIRRNLVLASAAIIFWRLLRVDPSVVMQKLLELDKPIDAQGLLIVGFVVLGYLAFRYRDAAVLDSQPYVNAIELDFPALQLRTVKGYGVVLEQIWRWTGIEMPAFNGILKVQLARILGTTKDKLRSQRAYFDISGLPGWGSGEQPKRSTKGVWQFSPSYQRTNGDGNVTVTGELLSVEVKSAATVLTMIYLYAWWWLWCRSAVAARMPVYCGLAALGVLWTKLLGEAGLI